MADDTALSDLKSKFEQLLRLRERRDIDDAAAKRSNREYREFEAALYAELEEGGVRGRIEFDFGPELGVAKFQRRSTVYGRVIDKAAAIAALKKEGLDSMLTQEAISERRLNELARDRLESRTDFPDGIDFYHRSGISISRK